MGRAVRFDEKAESVTAMWESGTRKALKEAAKTRSAQLGLSTPGSMEAPSREDGFWSSLVSVWFIGWLRSSNEQSSAPNVSPAWHNSALGSIRN
jgi:hypothetical protein